MKFWTQNLSTRSTYFILSANANRNSKNRWESRYCCFEIKSQTPDPPTVAPVLFSYPNGSKICLDDLKQNYDSNLKKSYIQNLYQHFHLISFPNSDKNFRLPYLWPSFAFEEKFSVWVGRRLHPHGWAHLFHPHWWYLHWLLAFDQVLILKRDSQSELAGVDYLEISLRGWHSFVPLH